MPFKQMPRPDSPYRVGAELQKALGIPDEISVNRIVIECNPGRLPAAKLDVCLTYEQLKNVADLIEKEAVPLVLYNHADPDAPSHLPDMPGFRGYAFETHPRPLVTREQAAKALMEAAGYTDEDVAEFLKLQDGKQAVVEARVKDDGTSPTANADGQIAEYARACEEIRSKVTKPAPGGSPNYWEG